MPFNKPCLDCGKLSRGTRCDEHQAIINRQRNAIRDSKPERKARKKLLYTNDYRKRAAHIRATATHCHICQGGIRVGDPFEADHLYPSDPTSPLAPAHRSCNQRRGNKPLDTHGTPGTVPPRGDRKSTRLNSSHSLFLQ
jgi:hypothetical protein